MLKYLTVEVHPKDYYTSLNRKQFYSDTQYKLLDMRDFSEKGYRPIWILKIYYYACDLDLSRTNTTLYYTYYNQILVVVMFRLR